MRLILIIPFFAIACSSSIQTVGIYNNSETEILIETKPNIRYGGETDYYVGLEKDSTHQGLLWKRGEINSIVVYPKALKFDTLGIYIMKPASGFWIGSCYLPKDKQISQKNIMLDYLKIVTPTDTIIADSKLKIWELINYDKKDKRQKNLIHDKVILVR